MGQGRPVRTPRSTPASAATRAPGTPPLLGRAFAGNHGLEKNNGMHNRAFPSGPSNVQDPQAIPRGRVTAWQRTKLGKSPFDPFSSRICSNNLCPPSLLSARSSAATKAAFEGLPLQQPGPILATCGQAPEAATAASSARGHKGSNLALTGEERPPRQLQAAQFGFC